MRADKATLLLFRVKLVTWDIINVYSKWRKPRKHKMGNKKAADRAIEMLPRLSDVVFWAFAKLFAILNLEMM